MSLKLFSGHAEIRQVRCKNNAVEVPLSIRDMWASLHANGYQHTRGKISDSIQALQLDLLIGRAVHRHYTHRHP